MNKNHTNELTDKQLLAGVAALRELEQKFKGQATDQAVVYAIYSAVVEATDQPPAPTYQG
jgi:hypothetical protein